MTKTKRSVLTAVCIALCVVLPMAFHAVPNAGQIFLPMHIPVLLAGLCCGWPFGLLAGVAGPLLSSLFTGMPPLAYLPSMLCELALYGLLSGAFSSRLRSGRLVVDLYLSLVAAMLLGRVAAGLLQAALFSAGNYSLAIWAAAYFVQGLPGIVIQLLLLPPLVMALEHARLIPRRYPRRTAAATEPDSVEEREQAETRA